MDIFTSADAPFFSILLLKRDSDVVQTCLNVDDHALITTQIPKFCTSGYLNVTQDRQTRFF